MGSLGPMHLLAVLLAVAIIAATSGFLVARRTKRRARGIFAVGFFCGLTAGTVLRRRHWLYILRRRRGWARGR
jgi:hypothetical protein